MFERLRELRQAKGLTCEQVAEKMGLTKATYNKKERGIITITLSDAKKIASIIDYSIEDIFSPMKYLLQIQINLALNNQRGAAGGEI